MTCYIETERMILRDWQSSDYDDFLSINQDPHVMEFLYQTLSSEENQDLIDRIKLHFKDYGYGLYACELKATHKFIGFVGLNVPDFEESFTPCVEIGWRLAHEVWGQGLAPEAGKAVLDYAFNVLNLNEIVSFTTLANKNSIRVMQKLNMRCDENENFRHPKIPKEHPISMHCLYRINKS